MAIAASYVASNQFSVASDKVVRFVAGRRVLADCGTDGEQYGTVASVSSTTVTLTMDSGDALTANLVSVQHGNDIPASLANHGHTGQADGGDIYATTSESQAGTSTTKAVTPAGLAAVAQAEGWGQFDDFFEANDDGDLMPSINPISSRNFTLNADGDIQPDAA